ncbi:hypothetical protein, partial [Ornithinimicrobium murale]|uniref:hypothetical protein n=1 Tax=Ornithinimicrobium murale TaxID=1050153 RepID=UPI001EDD8BE0
MPLPHQRPGAHGRDEGGPLLIRHTSTGGAPDGARHIDDLDLPQRRTAAWQEATNPTKATSTGNSPRP